MRHPRIRSIARRPTAILLPTVLLACFFSSAVSLAPSSTEERRGEMRTLGSLGRESPVDGTPLTRFQVELDEHPRLRWKRVIEANMRGVLSTMSNLFSELPEPLHEELDSLVLTAEARFPEWAREEMQGIADALNVTLGDVVMVNLFFEMTPFCTSIVAQSTAGRVYHARNMDFGLAMPTLSENLREIAVEVEFTRRGEPVFIITTFAGYIGAATGMRNGAFSITANEREMTGPLPIPNLFKGVVNLINALTTKVVPVTWSIRELLADDEADFETAVATLSSRHFATQMYLTVGGVYPGQGVVLTRGRDELLDTWRMSSIDGEWFLVQTNYDHSLPMPPWDDRKGPAEEAMKDIGSDAITPSAIYKEVLSLDPVLNKLTVYSTYMACSTGAYKSRVRDCKSCSPLR